MGDLVAAGWLNPDGTQATYTEEELRLIREQKHRALELARQALRRRKRLAAAARPQDPRGG